MKQKEEEWQRLVTEQAASGKSASSFCRERGITDNRFFYWRKRLSEAVKAKPAGKFVSVGGTKLVELELESGIKVRCGVESLKAVVDVLSS
jgi:transposase-like protein